MYCTKMYINYILFINISGELFALSERVSKVNESLEDSAVLYSTIQPVSTEFGCITMKYSGHNVNFDVFITNGTTFDPDEPIFYHQNVQTDKYISTSFQTPTDVPYMVGNTNILHF